MFNEPPTFNSPLKLTSPTTSSFFDGFVVPIPTLPFLSILNDSVYVSDVAMLFLDITSVLPELLRRPPPILYPQLLPLPLPLSNVKPV